MDGWMDSEFTMLTWFKKFLNSNPVKHLSDVLNKQVLSLKKKNPSYNTSSCFSLDQMQCDILCICDGIDSDLAQMFTCTQEFNYCIFVAITEIVIC